MMNILPLGARAAAAATLAIACGGPLPSTGWPAPVAVPIGHRPFDVAVGDVDGDGALDLVTANSLDRTISVRLGRGQAWTAAPGDPLAVEIQAHLIALADLDKDGDLDLLATDHDSDAVWVWLGDGAGQFARAPGSPFVAFSVTRAHNHGLAVGDVDGDGDPDVVAADQDARAASVLLGDGHGGLSRAPGSPVALGGEPYPPALAHIDDDGRLDLVVPLLAPPAIAILLGDGRGGFHHAPGSPHATVLDRPYAVVVGDLDRDGAPDVIAAHDDTDRISVLLGDGHGGLRAAAGSPIALGRRIWRMAAVDVDGDGELDVSGAGSGALVVLRGDGRGHLGPPRFDRVGGWTVVAADVDGDGRPDLVAPDPEAQAVRMWLSSRMPARSR